LTILSAETALLVVSLVRCEMRCLSVIEKVPIEDSVGETALSLVPVTSRLYDISKIVEDSLSANSSATRKQAVVINYHNKDENQRHNQKEPSGYRAVCRHRDAEIS
jgi:uncharacterized membrane protein